MQSTDVLIYEVRDRKAYITRDHPLGLRRLAYITIVVADLDKGKRVYAGADPDQERLRGRG